MTCEGNELHFTALGTSSVRGRASTPRRLAHAASLHSPDVDNECDRSIFPQKRCKISRFREYEIGIQSHKLWKN